MSSCSVCRRSMPAARPPCRAMSSTTADETTTATKPAPASSSVCEACKKFHWRCLNPKGGAPSVSSEPCTCPAPADAAVERDLSKCRRCRFNACCQYLASTASPNAHSSASPASSTCSPSAAKSDEHKVIKPKIARKQSKTEFYKIPCAVCGFSSLFIFYY